MGTSEPKWYLELRLSRMYFAVVVQQGMRLAQALQATYEVVVLSETRLPSSDGRRIFEQERPRQARGKARSPDHV